MPTQIRGLAPRLGELALGGAAGAHPWDKLTSCCDEALVAVSFYAASAASTKLSLEIAARMGGSSRPNAETLAPRAAPHQS